LLGLSGKGWPLAGEREHFGDSASGVENVDLAIQLSSELCRVDDRVDEPLVMHRLIQSSLAAEGESTLSGHPSKLKDERHVFI
jgi:hypothetical protein